MSTVGFFGSRNLHPGYAGSVSSAVGVFARAGRTIATGCAVGADAYALSAALASAGPGRTTVFCAFDSDGKGSWGKSNVEGVQAAAAHGADVRWLAGGPLTSNLVWRLVNRSRRMVDSISGGLRDEHSGIVGWITAPPPGSPGSWGTINTAVALGLRVAVFNVGWGVSLLPSIQGGSWIPAGGGIWAGAVLYVPR